MDHDSDDPVSVHSWQLAYWRGHNEFGISLWACWCGATRRVLHDPGDLEVFDPSNLQEAYIKREHGRVGVWSGE